jgi:hypothetical protein
VLCFLVKTVYSPPLWPVSLILPRSLHCCQWSCVGHLPPPDVVRPRSAPTARGAAPPACLPASRGVAPIARAPPPLCAVRPCPHAGRRTHAATGRPVPSRGPLLPQVACKETVLTGMKWVRLVRSFSRDQLNPHLEGIFSSGLNPIH